MNMWAGFGLAITAAAAGLVVFAHGNYRSAMSEADGAYRNLLTNTAAPADRFDPSQISGLPEIAQRYFRHAIAPGTPLYSTVRLEMDGSFLLGDKDKYQTYSMTARQVLKAPDQFVWLPKMHSGAMTVSGSDALVHGTAWTRFWLLGLVPVAQDRTSTDLVRSAQFRAAVEGALFLPTSLLPVNGVDWEQNGDDRAKVTLHRVSPAIILYMTLDRSGAVREVVGQRRSNANRDKVFRLQPFGGTMKTDRTFQGLTIPTEIHAGNLYGTVDYLPFFQVRITSASYS